MPTGFPQSTIYGPLPTVDLQLANKAYVDASGGATVTTTNDVISSNFTTTSASFVDITGLSITAQAASNLHVVGGTSCFNTGSNITQFRVQGTADGYSTTQQTGGRQTLASSLAEASAGQAVIAQGATDGGTATFEGVVDQRETGISMYEVA